MPRLFYTLLHYLLLPLLLLRIAWRSRSSPGYGRAWWQRFGWVPQANAGSRPLWLHAVSVGETIAARPLVEALLARHPDVPLLISGMTATGAERVAALFGDRVTHVFAPYDTPDIIGRFLARVRPRALLIMETELWPNWIAACTRRGIPTLLLNGRMSARSARGYARVGALSRPLFAALTWVAAQSEADAQRYRQLGVRDAVLSITGSVKFDAAPEAGLADRAAAWRQAQLDRRPVWVAGSTHEGEEVLLLDAHRAMRERIPDLLLILVPRHPERFDAVAALIDRRGLRCVRRSRADPCGVEVDVLLGDTMGELLFFYAVCDLAFIGGSLVARGGHNPLEAAMLGKPVLAGPHLFNFQSICADLVAAGAMEIVDQEHLELRLTALLEDRTACRHMGDAGLRVMASNRGALERLLSGIERHVFSSS